MTSALGKSSTFAELSGLVRNGLVNTTFPVGEVMRKIDQENHSSFTGSPAANAAADHVMQIAPSASARSVAPMRSLIIVFPIYWLECAIDYVDGSPKLWLTPCTVT